MICKYCNAGVSDGIRFCPYCHHPVNYAPITQNAGAEATENNTEREKNAVIKTRLEGCIDTYSTDIVRRGEAAVSPRDPSALTEIPESYGTQLYEAKESEVAVILSYAGDIYMAGTGFFLGDGLLATNYHVVSYTKNKKNFKCDKIAVNYKDQLYKAKIVKVNTKEDVAIIQLQGDYPDELNDICTKLGNSDTVKPGSPLISIGNSLNDGLSFNSFTAKTAPKITSTLPHNHKVILLNNSAQCGNSGGPLYDRFGHVVGIITGAPMKTTSLEIKRFTNENLKNLKEIFGIDTPTLEVSLEVYGMAYAVPVETLKRLLNTKCSEEV